MDSSAETRCNLPPYKFSHRPLYHYTDINAVKSILSNQMLWLTDLRYLNDSKELKNGLSVFIESLKKWSPTLFTKREYSKAALAYIEEEINLALLYGLNEQIMCTCSFSRIPDQLSQWRGYGNYMIEFDEKELSQSFPKLYDCTYQDPDKIKIAADNIIQSVDNITIEMDRDHGNMRIQGLDELTKIIGIAATFKDLGFVEENEVRIIASEEELNDKISISK